MAYMNHNVYEIAHYPFTKSHKRKLPSNRLLVPRNISIYMKVAVVLYITSGQNKIYMMKIALFLNERPRKKSFHFCWGCVLATCLSEKLNLYASYKWSGGECTAQQHASEVKNLPGPGVGE